MPTLAERTRNQYPATNVIPAWLLFYWRVLRTTAAGDYAKAWAMLPSALPMNVTCPTVEGLAAMLVYHHLIDEQ